MSVDGKVTNANYSNKKAIYIIFINNRLVECASIRRTIENVYTGILPKHMHPFVYLSIQMPPQHIDVNVHPTKKEVHFLFEEELLELIHVELSKLLSSANESRSFLIQTTLFDPSSNNLLSSDTPSTVQAPPIDDSVRISAENQDGGKSNLDFSKFLSHSSSPLSLHDDSKKPEFSLQEFSNSSSSVAHQGKEAGSAKRGSTVSEAAAVGAKRVASVSSSTNLSAKVSGNKMIRTDPNLMKINSFFVKANTSVSKAAVEAPADGNRHDDRLDRSMEEAQPEKNLSRAEHDNGNISENVVKEVGRESSLAAPQLLQKEAPFSFLKNRKVSCTCCDGQPDPKTHIEKSADGPHKETQVSSVFKLPAPVFETVCPYMSIRGMINDMHKSKSSTMESILKGNTFVGVVSHSLSLIQWGTKLVLVNHTALARSLFFQVTVIQTIVKAEFSIISVCTIVGDTEIRRASSARVERSSEYRRVCAGCSGGSPPRSPATISNYHWQRRKSYSGLRAAGRTRCAADRQGDRSLAVGEGGHAEGILQNWG